MSQSRSTLQFQSSQSLEIDQSQVKQFLQEIETDPMGGWLNLPQDYGRSEFKRIKKTAQAIQTNSEYLVCIGIGGSYLGHRAVIDALQPQSPTKVLYAGNSLSPRELDNLFAKLDDKDFSINVISKSGTTTEPAIAFRFLKEKLFARYGDRAASRIYATTDASFGALHNEAVQNNYSRFTVPNNIGGRYSVLTAVGLLPLAVSGVDIDQLMSGAARELLALRSSLDHDTLDSLPAVQYAYMRHSLYQSGLETEVFATFEPCLREFGEWWKQLFGESEGKQHQGILPTSVVYTTGLHSLGQYLQDGRRNIFETMLEFTTASGPDFQIPSIANNPDGLGYLEGMKLSDINQKALQATVDAHRNGGIPVLEIISPELDIINLGRLIYFFELACALSAKLSGVNTFDQPGVEDYKTRMFELLGRTS